MRTYTPDTALLVPEQAEKVFKGEIFDVYQWQQKQFDGSYKTFEMVKRPDTVDIIAVHEDKIILSKEQQPHTDTYLCLPAGMHDIESEDELAAAKRELREETGYSFKSWKLIEARQAGSGKIEQIIYTFLATDLESINEQQLDVGEKIEVVTCTFDEYKNYKDNPQMRFYPTALFSTINSLDELLEMPPLYNYGN